MREGRNTNKELARNFSTAPRHWADDDAHSAILENIEEPYYEVDLKGNLVLVNTAFCRLLGYSEQELLGMNNRAYQEPEVAARVYRTFNDVYHSGVPTMAYDWDMVRKDGTKVVVEGSVHPIKDGQGRPIGFRGLLRDVTARRRAEQALRDSEERFRGLTELSSDWYWEQDGGFRFVRFEGRGKADFGNDLGKTSEEIGFTVESGGEPYRELLERRRPYRDVVMSCSLGGELRVFSVSGEPMFDRDGRFLGYRGVSRDITEQKHAEKRIQYLATHDELTGLPNRAMFGHVLTHALESARRHSRKLAVLFIDVDRFKDINDTLGHAVGDLLLKQMAGRLSQSLRAKDVVARFGGDEFVILLRDWQGLHNEIEQVTAVARKILQVVTEPMYLSGQECEVTASIGISMYPTDAQDEQSLTRNADLAMYVAKEEGKNDLRFYSQDMIRRSVERLALETSLRRALERNELFLQYQPKQCLGTGRISGVEALIRWRHPEMGLVLPKQFIPLAEDTGLIVPIGRWVLETACAQSMAWQEQGLPPTRMAVNLSARQFASQDLLKAIACVLEKSNLAPDMLELEITESMVMQNTERAIELLTAIKKMGVHLAIDDFGTGYSSMALIKRYPIDTLKLDSSFVRGIPENEEDNAIAKAILGMGKALGLTVVAEGVETQDQQNFLRDNGCDEIQGYYFSHPISPDKFVEFLREHMIAQLQSVGLRALPDVVGRTQHPRIADRIA